MEVNLRSSESTANGIPGRSVAVDTAGEDIVPDNPNRNVLHLRCTGTVPVTLYFCANAQRAAIPGGGGAGQSITLAPGDPILTIDRYNGPISGVSTATTSVGLVEYDLSAVAVS